MSAPSEQTRRLDRPCWFGDGDRGAILVHQTAMRGPEMRMYPSLADAEAALRYWREVRGESAAIYLCRDEDIQPTPPPDAARDTTGDGGGE